MPRQETQPEGGLAPRLWVILRERGPPISGLRCLGAAFTGGCRASGTEAEGPPEPTSWLWLRSLTLLQGEVGRSLEAAGLEQHGARAARTFLSPHLAPLFLRSEL